MNQYTTTNRIQIAGFLSLLFFSTTLSAQSVDVATATETIDGKAYPGLQTVLNLDEKKVKDSWRDLLKTYGKVEIPKEAKNRYEVKMANIPEITSLPLSITSTANTQQGATTIFWAMRLDSTFITQSGHPQFAKVKSLMHDFAVKMYQEKVNAEVTDAQKLLDKQLKEQTATLRESENLAKSVEKNKAEKIKLEEEVVKNKEDAEKLVKEMETSKKEYQQALTAWEDQNKVMEELKGKPAEEVSADRKKEETKKLDFLNKQKQTRANEGKRLEQNSEKNEREKQTLLTKLQKNATELEHLLLSIEQNKKKQTQDISLVEERKKELEVVKGRLASIK